MRQILMIVMSILVSSHALAAGPGTTPCPYTAAELKAALGLDLKDGKVGLELPFSGGKMLDCRYDGKNWQTPALWLKQTVMAKPDAPENANYFKSLAGAMEKIPGDADGAMFQGNQGDNTNATLVYMRKGVIVEARVRIKPTDPGFAAMKQKLAKLRRIP